MADELTDSWCLPPGVTPEALYTRLGKKFRLLHQAQRQVNLTYCDSFDWRLLRGGYLLGCNGTSWTLFDRASGAPLAQERGPRLGKRCFSWELPPGRLQDLLAPLLEMRSVLPLVMSTVTTQETRILNRDDKTVVRLALEQHLPEEGGEPLQGVHLEPVRGYTSELEALRKFFAKLDPLKRPLSLLDLEQGLARQGRSLDDYSSRFELQLDPDQTAGSALIQIYLRLLASMQVNLPGTLADLDSEFLHDFRVAIRRTRSGLALIKKVFPAEVVRHYQQAFAYLGQITGPTRDLDVYLLYEELYRSRLPEFLHQGFHAFFEDLALLRAGEQKKMARALRGPRVEEIFASWGNYLKEGDISSAPLAEVPVVDVARRVISKRYQRVLKDGRAITPKSPDQDIHRLRIQGKKLRYTIEFFGSLFPEEEIALVIKRLKKLQNYLGDFNDLSVQQEMLHHHLQGIRPGSRRNLELGAALGGLVSTLHQEQLKARGNFGAVFERFSGGRNEALFTRLFS
ncbi:CYTH and CHAD domain-containing protein [Desulfogranum mediterraneum]|uniref:CYTH and CHAD domain-containing protein n=1 Tax=Desulfogranum mediterraneum TaxID=160661 RepID=UPI00041A7F7E|nr:CHAD domain-containing protein [Desulfogranum mediterraneum]